MKTLLKSLVLLSALSLPAVAFAESVGVSTASYVSAESLVALFATAGMLSLVLTEYARPARRFLVSAPARTTTRLMPATEAFAFQPASHFGQPARPATRRLAALTGR